MKIFIGIFVIFVLIKRVSFASADNNSDSTTRNRNDFNSEFTDSTISNDFSSTNSIDDFSTEYSVLTSITEYYSQVTDTTTDIPLERLNEATSYSDKTTFLDFLTSDGAISETTTPTNIISDSTIAEYSTSGSTSIISESTTAEYSTSGSTSIISESTTSAYSTSGSTSTIAETSTIVTTTVDYCDNDEEIEFVQIIPDKFSLFVEWKCDETENNCNYWYEVKLSSVEIIKSTTDCHINITNLNACQNYAVEISRKYNDNIQNRNNDTATTLEANDEILEISYTKNNKTMVTIAWETPKRIKNCIQHYMYKIIRDSKIVWQSIISNTFIHDYFANECVNNTYVINAVSNNSISPSTSISYSDYKVNNQPIFLSLNISNDIIKTKWEFGEYVCQPKEFFVNCRTENDEFVEVKGNINLVDKELKAELENLTPYTKYSCCGIILNNKGNSSCGQMSFTTDPKAADKPTELSANESTQYNMEIFWQAPKKWNGEDEWYNLTVEFIKLNYRLPKCCNQLERETQSFLLNTSVTSYRFTPTEPGAKYNITLRAKSSGGWSNDIETIYNTYEGVPESPNTTYQILWDKESLINDYNVTLILNWNTPCQIYGVLEQYYLVLYGFQIKNGDYNETVIVPPSNDTDDYQYIAKLKPEYNYIVTVRAKLKDFYGKVAQTTFSSPAGIPKLPEKVIIKEPNTTSVPDPGTTAIVYIQNNLFDSSMGDIIYYAIIVAQEGCEEQPKADLYNSDNWPNIIGNEICINETKAYEATKMKWNPFHFKFQVYNVEFTLGIEKNCTELEYCNRPLSPNTNYSVKIRGFTKNGFSDTKLIYFTTAELLDNAQIGLIVGLIVGILAIAALIAGILFYTKGKLYFTNWPRMDSTAQISPTPLPVPIKKFNSHYTKMIENPGKIKNEFQLLSTVSSDVTLSTKTALLPINKKKNRYINILPYDQTRVKLLDINTSSSDYINASFIRGYSGSNEYIATQGPTESTCPAFWQMIAEQNIKIIVMLTQFVELGKPKCYKYFPDLNEEYDLSNDIKIECLEEEILPVYTRRIFQLTKDAAPKKIIHVQFNLWPDFDVPNDVSHTIDFSEIIKEIKMKKPSIIVMHCSAGVGRTGTLIAVDILLQNIRDKRKVDIFGTVLNLRKQRMNMVQSEKQYEFLYKCVHYVINTNYGAKSHTKIQLHQISESNML